MLKNSALLFISMLVLLCVALESVPMDGIAMTAPNPPHAIVQEANAFLTSVFQRAAQDFPAGAHHGDVHNLPLSTLLLMGLFGLAFWGRFSMKRSPSSVQTNRRVTTAK